MRSADVSVASSGVAAGRRGRGRKTWAGRPAGGAVAACCSRTRSVHSGCSFLGGPTLNLKEPDGRPWGRGDGAITSLRWGCCGQPDPLPPEGARVACGDKKLACVN